jgi:hypothetical protein
VPVSRWYACLHWAMLLWNKKSSLQEQNSRASYIRYERWKKRFRAPSNCCWRSQTTNNGRDINELCLQ